MNFQEPIQEHRTLDFRFASVKKEPGEANMKKRYVLICGVLLYIQMILSICNIFEKKRDIYPKLHSKTNIQNYIAVLSNNTECVGLVPSIFKQSTVDPGLFIISLKRIWLTINSFYFVCFL